MKWSWKGQKKATKERRKERRGKIERSKWEEREV